MITQDALTFWLDARGTHFVRTAKRVNQSFSSWSDEHLDQVLGSQASTNPAGGSGDPKVSTITFTLAGSSMTCEIRTFQDAGESESSWKSRHDEAVEAMKDAIEDQGGVIQ
jgi:hypothetical protein